jgi:hypothetical protein
MARPPAYYLYSDGRKTVHASNSLQDLVKVAKLHAGLVGRRYDLPLLHRLFGRRRSCKGK